MEARVECNRSKQGRLIYVSCIIIMKQSSFSHCCIFKNTHVWNDYVYKFSKILPSLLSYCVCVSVCEWFRERQRDRKRTQESLLLTIPHQLRYFPGEREREIYMKFPCPLYNMAMKHINRTYFNSLSNLLHKNMTVQKEKIHHIISSRRINLSTL